MGIAQNLRHIYALKKPIPKIPYLEQINNLSISPIEHRCHAKPVRLRRFKRLHEFLLVLMG
uniref:Uncharacterized protein n=1 Tax=Myoviridae sp. ctRci5 TaxID=2825105 RepID=A0A8S5V6M4_9CAUD|nr:MAG TPA: hypothetical protein [Myoviridae sp. ctRci5]